MAGITFYLMKAQAAALPGTLLRNRLCFNAMSLWSWRVGPYPEVSYWVGPYPEVSYIIVNGWR